MPAPLRARDGFGLVESLVSMGIAAAGLMAVAGLMVVGTQQMASTRDGGKASMVATSRFERLRMLPHNHVERQIGTYSVTVADPVSGTFTVQWAITNGPAGTYEVAVTAQPSNRQGRPATVRGLLWRP